MPTERTLTYAQAIHEALDQCMSKDSQVVVIGEGVPDPKGIFGTTLGLREKFGDKRVLDMPLSENGMTGVCLGAAMNDMRPVMVHQRIDFSMLAMDQLVNNAAKWHYMFDARKSIPLVVRLIVGRGWGQGPQHSQSLQATFAHIPGFKTVMPTTAYDAKGMMVSAIEDNNPVIFIEYRWLHMVEGLVPEALYRVPLDKSHVKREGETLTIAAVSYMTLEALQVAKALEPLGISIEVIDIRSLNQLDMEPVYSSVKKTGHLMVLDTGWTSFGASSEIVSRVVENQMRNLKKPPVRIAMPDHPVPTSHHLANHYYPDAQLIGERILELLDRQDDSKLQQYVKGLGQNRLKDVPNPEFKGPF